MSSESKGPAQAGFFGGKLKTIRPDVTSGLHGWGGEKERADARPIKMFDRWYIIIFTIYKSVKFGFPPNELHTMSTTEGHRTNKTKVCRF